MKFTFSKPVAAEMRAFFNDRDSVDAAIAARNDMARAIRRLNPFTVACLMQLSFPGADWRERLDSLLWGLAKHGKDCVHVLDSDNAKHAPFVAAAAHRSLEIVGEIRRVDSRIAGLDRAKQAKREVLEEAGVSPAEQERLLATDDLGALIAEKAALIVEGDALEQYVRLKDESLLPAGFKAAHLPADGGDHANPD
jgi:hypothetical protein